jgi:hypothetical protein
LPKKVRISLEGQVSRAASISEEFPPLKGNIWDEIEQELYFNLNLSSSLLLSMTSSTISMFPFSMASLTQRSWKNEKY